MQLLDYGIIWANYDTSVVIHKMIDFIVVLTWLVWKAIGRPVCNLHLMMICFTSFYMNITRKMYEM